MSGTTRTFGDRARGELLRIAEMVAGIIGPVSAESKAMLTASYQPMVRAILIPGALYYFAMAVVHALHETMLQIVTIGSLRVITALTCLVIAAELGRRTLSHRELEVRTLIPFAMIYAMLFCQQIVEPVPDKLIYFLLHAVITATIAVSVRLALLAMLIEVPTMIYFAGTYGTDMQAQYAYIGVTGSFVGISMAMLTRFAIRREIGARLASDRLRRDAEHLAEHDQLTLLPNRRMFLQALESRFKRRKGAVPAFAIGIIDLDDFKAVNDTLGHAVGDALLVETSRRLSKVCGDDFMVARLGGDQFGVIIDVPAGEEQLAELGQALRETICKPCEVTGIEVAVCASVSFVPEQITLFTSSEMLERADFAMARAKQRKDGVAVFTQDFEERRREKSAVEHNLRHSDLESEMHVVFQPQTDIRTGRTVGFEALARWENRELGKVRPDIFIPAAERIGVIGKLTPMFLRKALEAARHWPDEMKLSFNLSIRDIDSPAVIEELCSIVQQSGIPADRIAFEVTETLIMADFDQAQRSLDMLQKLGAGVALDDFGVGYANFGHIDRLNINTIKIDRSFVTRLAEGGNTCKIMKTMIDMCSNLGVGCIVEGVETAEELAVLRQMGARYIQGYFFSAPIDAGNVAAYLARELADGISAPKAENAQAV